MSREFLRLGCGDRMMLWTPRWKSLRRVLGNRWWMAVGSLLGVVGRNFERVPMHGGAFGNQESQDRSGCRGY